MSITLIQDSYYLGIVGGVWTSPSTGSWYNGTAEFASKSTSATADSAYVHATFQGTSVAFIGITPPSNDSTTFIVSMDKDGNYTGSYPPGSEVGGTWYTSYEVADETTYHELNIYGMDQTIVDYVLITAGTQTNLTGQTIFVDDSNSEIAWSGQWWSEENYDVITGAYNVTPAGNGTHSSATVGDSLAFKFAGTSISVYGIMSWGSDGSIGATFSIDGLSQSSMITANGASSGGLINSTNHAFFTNSSLSSGNHTLAVNVTSVSGNLPFIIDYLTYIPNFANLDSKPNFTGQAGASGGSSGGSSSSSAPSSGSSGSSSSNVKTSKKSPTGAIVGGVIGGLVVVAAVLGAIIYLRRRVRLEQPMYFKRTTDLSESNDKLAGTSFTPFTDSPSTSKEVIPMNHMHARNTVSPPSTVVSGPSTTHSEKSRGAVMAWSGNEDHDFASTSGFSTPPQGSSGPGGPRATVLRRQIANLSQQLEEEQMAAQSPLTAGNISDLQDKIDMLTRENERLRTDVAPPAYVDGADVPDIGSGGDEMSSSGWNPRNDEKQAQRFAHI